MCRRRAWKVGRSVSARLHAALHAAWELSVVTRGGLRLKTSLCGVLIRDDGLLGA
jgi:hypothetical protein